MGLGLDGLVAQPANSEDTLMTKSARQMTGHLAWSGGFRGGVICSSCRPDDAESHWRHASLGVWPQPVPQVETTAALRRARCTGQTPGWGFPRYPGLAPEWRRADFDETEARVPHVKLAL